MDAAQFDAISLRPVDAVLPFPTSEEMRSANVFGLHEAEAIKLAERARWY